MNKAAPAILAPIIGGLMFAAMGTTQGVGFDYKSASEERQQHYLDGLAKGFERGFAASSGKAAVIERVSANAQWDTISVDVRFTQQTVESATADQIEDFRRFYYKQNCSFFAEKSLFEQEITLKMRVKRPSGSILTNFTVNEQNCAPYRKAT
ncbi:MAG: hypothetical protein AAB227_01225 [Pseudomonadota bacterium]